MSGWTAPQGLSLGDGLPEPGAAWVRVLTALVVGAAGLSAAETLRAFGGLAARTAPTPPVTTPPGPRGCCLTSDCPA